MEKLLRKNLLRNKNLSKNKQKTDRQYPKTSSKDKAIQTKSHTEAYTYTLKKQKKGIENIYHCSQSPPPQFGMIRCLFKYSTDAAYSKSIVEI